MTGASLIWRNAWLYNNLRYITWRLASHSRACNEARHVPIRCKQGGTVMRDVRQIRAIIAYNDTVFPLSRWNKRLSFPRVCLENPPMHSNHPPRVSARSAAAISPEDFVLLAHITSRDLWFCNGDLLLS